MITKPYVLKSMVYAAFTVIFTCFSLLAHSNDTNPFAWTPYDREVETAESFFEAISEGDTSFSFRLRHEDVEQDFGLFEQGAQATTLRSTVSYETKQFNLFSAFIQFEDVRAIPDDDNHNDGSNNQFDDALVVDPEGTNVNQVWLAYDIANTLMKYGKQEYSLDNSRHIGSEPWRQNNQRFNGFTVLNESLNYLELRYAYLNHVETIYGKDNDLGDHDLSAHLFNIRYRGFINSALSLFYYDVDNDSGLELWDTKTYGIRFAGRIENDTVVEYAFEYANQESTSQNPGNYAAAYYQWEMGVTYRGVHILLGQELLGGDDDNGYFVTPLGSQHEFQGQSDTFTGLGNIQGGIDDQYARLGYVFNDDLSLIGSYHVYESDDSSGAGELGEEWGISLNYELGDAEFLIKYADYSADQFGQDTKKLWLSSAYAF